MRNVGATFFASPTADWDLFTDQLVLHMKEETDQQKHVFCYDILNLYFVDTQSLHPRTGTDREGVGLVFLFPGHQEVAGALLVDFLFRIPTLAAWHLARRRGGRRRWAGPPSLLLLLLPLVLDARARCS